MTSNDPWKKYLEAGFEMTQVTRKRAEALVKDLVKAGEVQRAEAQERVEELLERSRKATEHVADLVRSEVTKQMEALGLVQPAKKATDTAKKAADTAKKAGTTAKKAASGTAKKSTTAAKKTVKKAATTAKKAAGGS